MTMIKCRHFTGYKPCGLSTECSSICPHLDLASPRILIVSLEALGAVLRSTVLLPGIRRKYPHSHVTWVTQAPAQHLLKNNPFIDRIFTTDRDDLLALRSLQFDRAYVVDKSLKASGVVCGLKVKTMCGFLANGDGTILPLNKEANELWGLGLSDEKKFYKNKKSEAQLLVEAMDLGEWVRDPYVLNLTPEEQELSHRRRRDWAPSGEKIIGINTGSSSTIEAKRLSVSFQRALVRELSSKYQCRVVLLGGPEDTIRNQQIAAQTKALLSPTERGLRDGISSVAACDVVVSGDSLGMHMAIALKKWVVAWFGPTCEQEIELYDRGVKVKTQAGCSPCWKRSCSKTPMCYDQVSMDEILSAVEKGIGPSVDYCLANTYRSRDERKPSHSDSLSGRPIFEPSAP